MTNETMNGSILAWNGDAVVLRHKFLEQSTEWVGNYQGSWFKRRRGPRYMGCTYSSIVSRPVSIISFALVEDMSITQGRNY